MRPPQQKRNTDEAAPSAANSGLTAGKARRGLAETRGSSACARLPAAGRQHRSQFPLTAVILFISAEMRVTVYSEKPLLESSASCHSGTTPTGGGDLGVSREMPWGEQQAHQALRLSLLVLSAPPPPSRFSLLSVCMHFGPPTYCSQNGRGSGSGWLPRAVWPQSPQLPCQVYSV